MPGMTGVELAIMLTRSIPDLKVLFFSGQASTVDVLEKARRGGHHFTALTKPVHPTDMLNRISECLATHKPIPPSSSQSHKTTQPQPTKNSIDSRADGYRSGAVALCRSGAGVPPVPLRSVSPFK